ncbi:hypothetical protein MKK88_03315 [Methylobacterium sp. E-005]|uniref:hypothetical protein n=1 Tax=Methylobacterium sp. E-005 TaxID=2836549 RepID=UPI001FB8E394|nr:hypothetical protein [Methylobacterium sp. E-005]MCJ2085025.1 hypothetical protein [Methylobacterium sp. E-005]
MTTITFKLSDDDCAGLDQILARMRIEEGSAPNRSDYLRDLFDERLKLLLSVELNWDEREASNRRYAEIEDEEERLVSEPSDKSPVPALLPASLLARVDVLRNLQWASYPEQSRPSRDEFLAEFIKDTLVPHVACARYNAVLDAEDAEQSAADSGQTYH